MFTYKRSIIMFILLYVAVYFAWIYIFQGNEYYRYLGANIFSISAQIFSIYLLYKTFHVIKDNQRYFWLLLCMGIACALISQVISMYYGLILNEIPPYPSWADFFWLLEYSLFLTAFIFHMKLLKSAFPMIRFLFNILIIMTVATSISWQFLLDPILSAPTDSLLSNVVTLAYPILDLGLLFATISLFFTERNFSDTTVFNMVIFGFLFQVVADSLYIYQSLQGSYMIGSLIDPLWTVTVLLKGAAGFYTYRNAVYKTPKQNNESNEYRGDLIPYISVIILLSLIVVTDADRVKGIEIGLIVSMVLIIIRQVMYLSENKKLLKELKKSSVELERTVEQRTEDLKNTLAKMEVMANHDFLTGLPNRHHFHERLNHEITFAEIHQMQLGVFFIDLDRFKLVNDNLGHEAGDCLLIEVTQRLKSCVRDTDIISRLGGDEFTVILPNIDKYDCIEIAERMVYELTFPFTINGENVSVTSSIGISLFPSNGTTKEELIRNADLAMYNAKAKGKNTYEFYNNESIPIN